MTGSVMDDELPLTVGLSDVALLARVQRPVVTVWRSRSAGTMTPFPGGVVDQGGSHRFALNDIVRWLAATRRGNNPSFAQDAAAFGALATGSDATTTAAVTALLVLLARHGELPTSGPHLLDLADEMDPDDDFLFSELDAVEDALAALARYATLLAEASFGPAAAFDKVLADRGRRDRRARAGSLSSPGVSVLAQIIGGLLDRLHCVQVSDPIGAAGPVVVQLNRSERPLAVTGRIGSGPSARLAARALAAHGVLRQPAAESNIALLGFPGPDRSDPSDLEVLRSIHAHVTASPGRITVLWGPASALTDSLHRPDRAPTDLDAEAEALRRRLLSGPVRAVLRLPAGLLADNPRRRMALWVLGGQAPDSGARIAQSDLSDRHLDDRTLSGLVTDILAALHGERGFRAHQAQVTTAPVGRTLAAAPGALVSAVAMGEVQPPAAALMERFANLATTLTAPLPAITPPTVTAREQPATLDRPTVSAHLTAGRLRYLPGLRVDADLPNATAGVLLVDGSGRSRTVDRFELHRRHPHVSYVEPGDVIFATTPRPRATVVRERGAVAVAPARVLRPTDPGLAPDVLAAAINSRAQHEKSWRTWPVPLLPADAAAAVDAATTALAQQRDQLSARLAGLDDLVSTVVDLAGSGTFDLHPALKEN